MKLSTKEAVFQNEVLTRFELFKSLFLTLPFQQVKDTGTLLPFFAQHCEKGVEKHQTPEEIINSFFVQHELYSDEQTQVDLLFRFVQYIERQVVLFDAIEDSSFKAIGKTDQSSQLGSLIKSSEILIKPIESNINSRA